MSYFLSFAVILSSLCNWKGAQSYKKLPEAIVPKVGHGPKMGQYGFDCAWFFVVFLFLLCFIAHLYEANGGRDMEVLACFRPGFFNIWNGFWDILKKLFLEKVCQGLGVAKTSWLGSKQVWKICPNWESRVSPGRHSRGNIFPKIRGGGVFYVSFDPRISKTVQVIKMCRVSKLL